MPTKKRKKVAPKKKRVLKRSVPKKRRSARKPAARKPASKKPIARKPAARKKQVSAKKLRLKEKSLGKITHYFPKVRAAVLKLNMPLAVGDRIKVKGHTTDFTQTITSMQIDHVPIKLAKKGDEIGLQVNSRVRRRDVVYKA